jgi:hypothetical protein
MAGTITTSGAGLGYMETSMMHDTTILSRELMMITRDTHRYLMNRDS